MCVKLSFKFQLLVSSKTAVKVWNSSFPRRSTMRSSDSSPQMWFGRKVDPPGVDRWWGRPSRIFRMGPSAQNPNAVLGHALDCRCAMDFLIFAHFMVQ